MDLYGSEALPAWVDLVHFERIPERSSLFHWEIEPHVHDALIQVFHPRRGGGEAVIDDTRWTLRPPCLIVAPARSVHGFRFLPDIDGPVVTAAQRPLESVAAAAPPSCCARSAARPSSLSMRRAASRRADAALRRDRARGAHLHRRRGGGRHVAAGGAVRADRAPGPRRRGAREAARSRKAAQIERFRSLLDTHFARALGRTYADELGVSPGQLTRLCHEVLGLTALEVINGRVLHEAQRELVYSSLGIKQIAAELGFADEAYFGRFFRKQTGHRPTEFRAMARGRLAAGSQAAAPPRPPRPPRAAVPPAPARPPRA